MIFMNDVWAACRNTNSCCICICWAGGKLQHLLPWKPGARRRHTSQALVEILHMLAMVLSHGSHWTYIFIIFTNVLDANS